MKRLKTITIVFCLMMCAVNVNAQTWNFGGNNTSNPSEIFGLKDPSNLNFITNNQVRLSLTQSGWLGLGILQPRGWQEINYCPSLGSNEIGLIVTRNYCHGNVVLTDLNMNDKIGDGIHEYNIGDSTPTPVSAVFKVPFSFKTGHNTSIVNPLYNSNSAPLFWVREQSPTGFWIGSTPDKFNTKFIIMPDGSCGINIAQPRAALDIRGSNSTNRPAAIIGSRSIGTTTIDSITGLVNYYTQQVHFVPILSENGYNQIVHNTDQGMFFSDGKGLEGANLSSAFVIAPWVQSGDSSIGGMRMDAFGNTEFHGTIRATKLNLDTRWWSDFVFTNDYNLPAISEVDSYIQINKHLPGVPSEHEILKNGLDVGDMQAIQQQKIEELTLYIIQLQKQIEVLNNKVIQLEQN